MRGTVTSLRLSEKANDAQTMNSGSLFHKLVQLTTNEDWYAEILAKMMTSLIKGMCCGMPSVS